MDLRAEVQPTFSLSSLCPFGAKEGLVAQTSRSAVSQRFAARRARLSDLFQISDFGFRIWVRRSSAFSLLVLGIIFSVTWPALGQEQASKAADASPGLAYTNCRIATVPWSIHVVDVPLPS